MTTSREQPTHGFYRSAAGREFMRELFERFLDRAPFSFGKLATMIADTPLAGQTPDDDNVKSALKRWAKGQDELWVSDVPRSMRAMKRLELEMQRIEEIKQVMDDRARTRRRTAVAQGLELFFLGESAAHTRPSSLLYSLELASGLYSQFSMAPEDTAPDPGLAYDEHTYHRYQRAGSSPYFLTQEFTVSWQVYSIDWSLALPPLRDRWSGFAYLGPNGQIFRFMVNHANPAERKSEVLYKDESMASEFVYDAEPGDQCYQRRTHRLFTWDSYNPGVILKEEGRFVGIRKETGPEAPVLKRHFDRISWEIPL